MRKIWMTLIVLCMSVLLLSACSDDKDKPLEEKSNDQVETESKESEETEDNPEEVEEVEDQLDLAIGETGTFDTTLGTYDMTLVNAEIIDEELEGEASSRAGFIVLDVTIKNTSDHAINLEDIIISMEVTANLDHSGSSDHAAGFDTIEEFDGELEPGDEKSAQFLTIIDASEEYYFRKMVGNIGAGYSNQVIWNISLEDTK